METCKQQIPFLKKEGPQYKNRLFHNNGDGYDMGVVVADFDNAGHPDLCVVGVTKNYFLHINGDGTFIDRIVRVGNSNSYTFSLPMRSNDVVLVILRKIRN